MEQLQALQCNGDLAIPGKRAERLSASPTATSSLLAASLFPVPNLGLPTCARKES